MDPTKLTYKVFQSIIDLLQVNKFDDIGSFRQSGRMLVIRIYLLTLGLLLYIKYNKILL